VAVNANASDPHYAPKQDRAAEIMPGDIVLIDMWAKLAQPDAVYYDITWMGFCGAQPPQTYERVFAIVREARDRAIATRHARICTATSGRRRAQRDQRSGLRPILFPPHRPFHRHRRGMEPARTWTIWRRMTSGG